MALTQSAQQLIREHFTDKPKNLAVDATCGNGHDTEFLARLGFKRVLGFDIQHAAITNTQARIDKSQLSNVSLIHRGHESMGEHINGKVDCVMFNFGYLPSADKTITTLKDTSLTALDIALESLANNGLICAICYPGHPEGAIETNAIQNRLKQLGTSWKVEQRLSHSPKPETPVLYTIKKRS